LISVAFDDPTTDDRSLTTLTVAAKVLADVRTS
jgi:hypothetical protein